MKYILYIFIQLAVAVSKETKEKGMQYLFSFFCCM